MINVGGEMSGTSDVTTTYQCRITIFQLSTWRLLLLGRPFLQGA
jgi:hypothetical protein